MIYIDLRRSTITGVKKYTQQLIEQGIYDRAIGGDWLEENFAIPYDRVVCNDYDLKANSRLPLGKNDVLHCPFVQYPFGFKGKTVVTVHDLIPLVVKGNVSTVRRIIYRIKVGYMIRHACHIIAVSESTKRDIIRYFNADPDKITVIYNGVDNMAHKVELEEAAFIYEKYHIDADKKIILMVGNRHNNKNFGRALEAFSMMSKRDEAVVVLVGKKMYDNDDVDMVVKKNHLDDSVLELSNLSDDDINALYNIADVFMFPSTYEGFGIPPLEAMNCGVPVICSNTTSLPEVVGDAAYMIDPYNTAEMSKALDVVLYDDRVRSGLIEKGYKRINRFSWKDSGDKTLKLLQRYEG